MPLGLVRDLVNYVLMLVRRSAPNQRLMAADGNLVKLISGVLPGVASVDVQLQILEIMCASQTDAVSTAAVQSASFTCDARDSAAAHASKGGGSARFVQLVGLPCSVSC